RFGQGLAQPPQFFTSTATWVSQPSIGSLVQWSQPKPHAETKQPSAQPATALANEHFMAQAVQLSTSWWRLLSQPSAAFMLQSPQPGSQVGARHPPAMQVDEAWGPAQALPQAPQLATSLFGSTHFMSQHFSPAAQRASPVQPGVQAATASLVTLQ